MIGRRRRDQQKQLAARKSHIGKRKGRARDGFIPPHERPVVRGAANVSDAELVRLIRDHYATPLVEATKREEDGR